MREAVHRPRRYKVPAPIPVNLQLRPPPVEAEPPRLQIAQLLVPMLGSATMLIYGVAAHSKLILLAGGIVVLGSLASPLLYRWSGRREASRRFGRDKAAYLAYLQDLLRKINGDGSTATDAEVSIWARQRRYLEANHPYPHDLPMLVQSARLWERRAGDEDQLDVVVGIGSVAAPIVIGNAQDPATSSLDGEIADYLRRVINAADAVPGVPIVCSLRSNPIISIEGPRSDCLAMARSMVSQLVSLCGPDELALAVAYPPDCQDSWSWVDRTPHLRVYESRDQQKRRHVRRLATTVDEVDALLRPLLQERLRLADDPNWSPQSAGLPHLVVVLDRYRPDTAIAELQSVNGVLSRAAELGITVLVIAEERDNRPAQAAAVLRLVQGADGAGSLLGLVAAATPIPFAGSTATSLAATEAETVTEVLQDLVLVTDEIKSSARMSARLVDLLDFNLDTTDPQTAWSSRSAERTLSALLGVSTDGSPLRLDLRESADGGDGPHGVVVGATGSGKSELLRAMVSSLAATHAPEDLTMMFVDFKGGPTFEILQDLPHCVGFVTNLERDPSMVDRVQAALLGELARRQRTFKEAPGDIQRLADYHRARQVKPDLPAMPRLFIVIDEFAELLAVRPDFLETLLSLARTGRNVGIHLLLASQRLENGRLHGLDTYLSYAICLRVFSVEESRAAIGRRDAADLPPLPGRGYLKTAEQFTAFQGARVTEDGQSVNEDLRTETGERNRFGQAVKVDTIRNRFGQRIVSVNNSLERLPESDVNRVVNWASEQQSAALLWKPPLPDTGAGELLALTDERLAAGGPNTIPIGLYDLARDREQPALTVDFMPGVSSHIAAVGGPRSGKSSFVLTMIAQSMRLLPANHVQFCVLETSPNIANHRSAFLNVGEVATVQEPDAVERVLRHFESLLEERARRNRQSMAKPSSANVLVIDGYAAFKDRYPTFDERIGRLLQLGPYLGVFIVICSGRWADISPRRLDLIGRRLELRLSDPAESLVDRKAAQNVTPDRRGRGLLERETPFQLAFVAAEHSAIGGVDEEVLQGVTDHHETLWPGDRAEPVHVLSELTNDQWISSVGISAMPSLGIAESTLHPVGFSIGTGSHLLISGDRGTGRSRLIARLIGDLLERVPDALVYVVDFRGALLLKHARGMLFTDKAMDTSEMTRMWGTTRHIKDGRAEPGTGLIGLLQDRFIARTKLLQNTAVVEPTPLKPIVLVVDDFDSVITIQPFAFDGLAPFAMFGVELNFTFVTAEAGIGSAMRVDSLTRRLVETDPWFLDFSTRTAGEPLRSRRKSRSLRPGEAMLVRHGEVDQLVQVLPPSLAVSN